MISTAKFISLLFSAYFLVSFSVPVFAQTTAEDYANVSGDQAISACGRSIQENPEDTDAFSGRGITLAQKSEFHKALADLNPAISLNL